MNDDRAWAEADLDRARERIRELERRLEEMGINSAQLETYATDLRRTYTEMRRHVQRMTALYESVTRTSSLDPDEVLGNLLETLGRVLDHDRATVYLMDIPAAHGGPGEPDTGPASIRARRSGPGAPEAAAETAPVGGVVEEAIRNQRVVVRGGPEGTEVGVPFVAGGRALGALHVVRAEAPLEDEVRVVELLATHVAVALQNAYLFRETQRLATIDPLTGLSNRRHFDTLLRLEVDRARRMGYPIGCIVVDMDHFRQINARYLHTGGDVALRRVADILRSRLRSTDVLGRVGGEEFVAVLPGASREAVEVVAEKIRQAVEALPALEGPFSTEPPLLLTVSVGGVSLPPESADAKRLVDLADEAMYAAKDAGRNQVRLWNGKIETHPTSGKQTRRATVGRAAS